MRPLTLPSEVTDDDTRQEVMRAWLDRGKLSLSLCHQFPAGYKPPMEMWAMLLSDVFHHVVDALVLETGLERPFIQGQIWESFGEVLRSDRGPRIGVLNEFPELRKELPDPDVSGEDEQCVEIARIILMKDWIRVVVRVGMWLPEEEEIVWGNLLYDLIYMVALSMKKDDLDALRERLAQKFLGYIERPSTEYSGHFF
jgi:hypothetical protein